jgi:hypothetical protein
MPNSEPKIFDECRRLAACVAPELSAAPLYVLNAADTGRPEPASCCGTATRHCDSDIRDTLFDNGTWRGPGPAVVLNLTRILADSSHDDFRGDVLQVFLHELGHILPTDPVAVDVEPTELMRRIDRELHAEFCEAACSAGADLADKHHDGDFVRRCCHLWWRAIVAGAAIPLPGLCAGFPYQQHPTATYFMALANECAEMHDKTFAEIEATAPPERFNAITEFDERYRAAKASGQRFRFITS